MLLIQASMATVELLSLSFALIRSFFFVSLMSTDTKLLVLIAEVKSS